MLISFAGPQFFSDEHRRHGRADTIWGYLAKTGYDPFEMIVLGRGDPNNMRSAWQPR